ncbi:MAG: RNB domain-containing ribonuclease [Vicinamibacterales bacterium]
MTGRQQLQTLARQAMLDRGLLPDFSPDVQREVASLDDGPPRTDTRVRDLGSRLWCSIDNDDSRDLDQLTAAEPLSGGAVRIFVAIADVDALVARGSAIDGHAGTNTTSVYTAAQVFPMLPERLSTDLTSLNEGVERLAIVVEMDVAPDGSVSRSDLYRAKVRNRAKLAYRSVDAWLDGVAPPPAALAAVDGLANLVRLQSDTAQAMRSHRHQLGALTLGTIDASVVFDGDALADLRVDRKNEAKELIEDFMIAANGVTARFLESAGLPSIRRVLRAPERWPRIVDLASSYGESLPDQPDAAALEAFLTKRRKADALRFPDVSLAVVKLLGSGEYAVDRPGRASDGHFGLAVRDYAHSTAPNRRFPDLITHRLLKAALDGHPSPYDDDTLEALARHCTTQENNAAKVERQVRKSAAALLFSSRVGETFDAIVTGASEKGTWVRVLRPPVEGKVVHGAHGLDVGDRVDVKLVHTDVAHGFIDFVRIH